jgi:hypothetical protein
MNKRINLSGLEEKWLRGADHCQRRAVGFREERQRILIVCEGTKTEPNYFKAIRRQLPPNLATVEIHGEGANTLSLVAKAREIRDSSEKGDYPFDQVWIVFDKDSFELDNFDNAIKRAEADKMRCARSNEAFEFWYILHFNYRDTGMSRNEYQKKLNEMMGEPYRKNSDDMYNKLARLGNQKRAIGWARKLLKDFNERRIPPSRSNPCTPVYLLVEELNRFLPPPEQTNSFWAGNP